MKNVFDEVKATIEEIRDREIDKIIYISDTEIVYEVDGRVEKISQHVVYRYLQEADEMNITTPKGYIEDLIKVTVKTVRAKETKIIKDKLKKLIDEL